MANTSTPIIKEEEEDPFSLLPHTTTSSSLSSSSDEDEDDEALFVVNLPPHTTTSSSSSWSAPIVLNLPPHMTSSSSTSSSISSITTPFLEQPLLLIEILEDRNIYTDDIQAYQYLVHHQGPGYSATSYSFNVVVHYLLPNVQIQHTVNINHQDDNHDVHLLFYNNTHPMGISINNIFIDDNADDSTSLMSTMYDRTDTDPLYVYNPDDFMSIGSASSPPLMPTTYDHLLLDPSASINQLFDRTYNPDDFASTPTAAPTYDHLLLDPSYVYDPNDFIIEV